MSEAEAQLPTEAKSKEVHYVDLDFGCVLARVTHDQDHENEPCLLIFFHGEAPRHRHHVKHGVPGQWSTWHTAEEHPGTMIPVYEEIIGEGSEIGFKIKHWI